MAEPTLLVFRHRPPVTRERNAPTAGESNPIPPPEALPSALREALAAYRDGAISPSILAHRLGIAPLAARDRLRRLRELEVIA